MANDIGYVFTTQDGRQYDPSGTVVTLADTQAHNARLEAAELARFAQGPDRWQGYARHVGLADAWAAITDKTHARHDELIRTYPVEITTWLGTVFARGRVTAVGKGFGPFSRMVYIRVEGTNGRTYVGKYGYDNGELCRLRAVKGRR